MKRISIAGDTGAVGLARDVELLQRVLQDHPFGVTVTAPGRTSTWEKLRREAHLHILRQPAYDAGVFVESVWPECLHYARVNCLIPNQEWFRESNRAHMGRIDWVLCKTRHAEDVFREAGYPTRYIGFTGVDCWLDHVNRDYATFFHIGGRDFRPETAMLIALWARHPEWPLLTICHGIEPGDTPTAANIRYITDWLTDHELRVLQNTHGIHLYPTDMEGFGHPIVEGMSAGAVVVTTDGAPMNELVTAERGVLVDTTGSEPHLMGRKYRIDPAALEARIAALIAMPESEKAALGMQARAWYVTNDRAFRERFTKTINDIAGA